MPAGALPWLSASRHLAGSRRALSQLAPSATQAAGAWGGRALSALSLPVVVRTQRPRRARRCRAPRSARLRRASSTGIRLGGQHVVHLLTGVQASFGALCAATAGGAQSAVQG